ncbi:MAG: hypothetical protein PHS57_01620 [Alphaproteobacteria bacterium]|nr:hypothetical protein [Alphaproteobacteria bacterium]
MGQTISNGDAVAIFKDAFATWNDSLHASFVNIEALSAADRHDPEKMIEAAKPTLDCYAQGATLWPTVESGFRKTPEGISKYFAHFAAKNPCGVVQGTPDVETVYGADGTPKIIVSGEYIFEMNGENGKRVRLPARFEFRLVQENGTWKWYHHTSNTSPDAQGTLKTTPVA